MNTNLGDARDVAQLTGGAMTPRRWLDLARRGVVPSGIALRSGHLVVFDLNSLFAWLHSDQVDEDLRSRLPNGFTTNTAAIHGGGE